MSPSALPSSGLSPPTTTTTTPTTPTTTKRSSISALQQSIAIYTHNMDDTLTKSEEPAASPTPPILLSVDESVQSADTPASTPAPGPGGEYGQFPPGTIVLAKLKSFPPWPAIIIPDSLVPERIQSSKPKNAPRSSTHRNKRKSQGKDASPTDQPPFRLWCVRFLKDDTFMWATSNDMSILTKEQIETFLNSKKSKNLIKGAYEMALDPPDVEEFIIYGSDGKPIDIDNEANDDDFKEDDLTPGEDDDDIDDVDDGSEVHDDNDLEITPVKKSPKKGTTSTKRKKTTPAKTVKKAKTTSKTKTPSKKGKRAQSLELPELDLDTSSDEDWDVDVDPSEEPVCSEYPDAKEIAAQIKKSTPLFKKARFQLQRSLLSGPEIDSDLSATLSTLNTLESLESPYIALINKSGLHKVLFTILKRPDLVSKDLEKIRKRVADLVQAWYGFDVPVEEDWTFEDVEEKDDVNDEVPNTSLTEEPVQS